MAEENPTQRLRRKLQENRKSLNIARLPERTKQSFIELAKEDFCDDYGMALRDILNCYFEHHAMKALFFQNIDSKLDYLIGKVSEKEIKEEIPKASEIKMCNGEKRIVRRLKKDE